MALFLLSLLLVSTFLGGDAAVFMLHNRCNYTIWPGITGQPALAGLPDKVVPLNSSQTMNITAPAGWTGEVWGRTGCSVDKAGVLKCISGNCDGGIEECGIIPDAPPPATSAAFLLDNKHDSYAINLLEGYNIPVSIVPSGGSGDCKPVSCLADLNTHCPSKLQLRQHERVVACKSPCLAFNEPEFCCRGSYDSPKACKPSSYSKFFKDSCPTAVTYLYDDKIFTCKAADYMISFC